MLHFATAADGNYGLPLAVMLTSLVRHLPAGTAATLHVLDTGLGESARKRVTRCVRDIRPDPSLVFHPIAEKTLDGFVVTGHFSPAAFARLLLPDLLPDVDRLLYVDPDASVEADLSELLALDLERCTLGAVRDFHVVQMGRMSDGRFPDEYGSTTTPYFNTGFMLIDLSGWRREGVHVQAADLLRTSLRGAVYPDQDGLNAVLQGRWLPLDERWNVQVKSLGEPRCMPLLPYNDALRTRREELLREAKFLHFTGSDKPWVRRSWPAVRGRYARALTESGWFSGPLDLEHFRWRVRWWERTACRDLESFSGRVIGKIRRTARQRRDPMPEPTLPFR